ncbi:Protein CBG24137 [Caenorhabditis briggsae]|uniref:Protein CBG24137 n=1 Tax=Caenorhabditis briggsae TaxID=6238 RepID=A8WK22_CAEBR|nr:Protein CBG24137 [Caenorhabditis briggsae]CAP20815.1 Protein CBG24137 [Caenorhabditis briggsae]
MEQSPIYYESKTATFTGSDLQLDVSDTNGIKCTWSGNVAGHQKQYSWNFDWRDLHSQGVDRLTGYIIIKERNNLFSPQKMEVDWTIVDQNNKRTITVSPASQYTISFEYSLTPHYATQSLYDAIFSPPDTVLVVEGKEIHVNKAFFSMRSDYFKVLFSNNFKEGSLLEIKEVSYDDFKLLCNSFSDPQFPDPQFTNDGTVEKLLKLARQFLLPSVTETVEHHLLHFSKIGFLKMIWLADEFKMSKLLEKCIRELDSLEKVKKLKELPEFEKLSDETKLLILGRIMKFL